MFRKIISALIPTSFANNNGGNVSGGKKTSGTVHTTGKKSAPIKKSTTGQARG